MRYCLYANVRSTFFGHMLKKQKKKQIDTIENHHSKKVTLLYTF